MKKTLQPIVFFGTEDFSATSLEALIRAKFNVALVVTKPDTKRGRGQKIESPLVKKCAEKNTICVLQPEDIRDIIPKIEALKNPCGVLVSFGKIIPVEIINLFSPGIINVHPSLLPLYRGPSPIESAIKNQDTNTGVSLMQLAERMDAGPVYAQEKIMLDQTETKHLLYKKCAQRGAEFLVEKLPDILAGLIKPIAQDEIKASYCSLLTKEDSLLLPNTHTAHQLHAQIRAHLGFPKSKITIGARTIIVLEASSSDNNASGELCVPCLNGSFLTIKKLIAPNGRTMSGEDFVRGYIR